MRILIHDFAGHPFQVQLSRSLAIKGYNVLHVYSKSIQTPKGSVNKREVDPKSFDVIGISQDKPFPKYSLIKRWYSEKTYAKSLIEITDNYRPDIVISGNTPLDIQKDFLTYCKKNDVRFIFWVQDIYSAALKIAFSKKLPIIGNLISLYYINLEKSLLANSDHIVVISDDFKKIIGNWINNTNITVIENWAPLNELQPQSKTNYWSIENGLSDKFCFFYAGTLGMKHNPDALMQLARKYRDDKGTAIVIISEGSGVEWLKNQVFKEKIQNVKFFDYLDFEHLPSALSSADVHIAILDKSAGGYCVPSKVLTYHCIGKPLLLSVPEGNLVSRIVKKQKSGLVTDSWDVAGFCRSAEKLKKEEKLRIQMGKNARQYAENVFNIDKKCDSFIKLFR